MPPADRAALPRPATAPLKGFLALCGKTAWSARLTELGQRIQPGSLTGRAVQNRHALELALARLAEPQAPDRANPAERRLLALATEAARLAARLAPEARARLRARLLAGLSGEATLIPIFHLLGTAARLRARGFEVRFDGLAEATPHCLTVTRDGMAAEVVCETMSAEEGRPVHRGDWCTLVDAINPDLQTWLAAHPGRYLLKVTLPDGLQGTEKIGELQRRITALLAAEKRQDSSADAVLKLDPLVLAGAQSGGPSPAGLPARLRAQFGPEAHLAVTADAGSGSVFVLAARAGLENGIAEAAARRLRQAAETRLSGRLPGILALLIDDLDRAEWRSLRESLELEGATRRFLTTQAAKPVVAVSCVSRLELFGLAAPDAAPDGELRFRNQAHPAARAAALAPAILSSV